MQKSRNTHTGSGKGDHEAGRTVYCKLFSDRVSPHLCDIRRKELIAQDTFSCDGCSSAQGERVSKGN